ncbi:MAG: hypothetical protein SFU98_00725 [Leptospiraceae bacterium]|nr:hypothetical protein [Leptospiraceae bacterium]
MIKKILLLMGVTIFSLSLGVLIAFTFHLSYMEFQGCTDPPYYECFGEFYVFLFLGVIVSGILCFFILMSDRFS